VPHPFDPGRSITVGHRQAVTAATALKGVANLEPYGVRVIDYLERIGIALVEVLPAQIPSLRADSTIDWIEPAPAPSSAASFGLPVMKEKALLQGQTTPWGHTLFGRTRGVGRAPPARQRCHPALRRRWRGAGPPGLAGHPDGQL
jgi:hypothetical protein